MATCTVCSQRSAIVRDLYCSNACYFVTEAGVREIKAKHLLKTAQASARGALLISSAATVGGIPADAQVELTGYANDDDGIDR